jgi:hypothetical protein
MKKGIIIALCSLAVLFTACKKPVEPTPEPVDYTADYIGDYLGQFTLTITSMNNQEQTGMAFPIENIGMEIAKAEQFNVITATVTVDNESHQTTGTATEEKADFGTVRLVIDKPDQNYYFSLDLKMEGTKAESDTLNIVGSFMGNGKATFPTPQGPMEQIFEEVSGTINGKLAKQ